MSFEERIKLSLFKIIYDSLELDKIENDFLKEKIKCKNIINKESIKLVSKYFFLANDVHMENLTNKEKSLLKKYLNNKDDINYNIFLKNNIKKLLIPNEEVKMIYYGGHDFTKMAPSDAIVLYFHYIEFGDDDEEKHDYNEDIINNNLNYIQDVLGKKVGLKVAIIKCNEVFNEYVKVL